MAGGPAWLMARTAARSLPTASRTATRSSICCSSVGAWPTATGSDIPRPRPSNRMRRQNEASWRQTPNTRVILDVSAFASSSADRTASPAARWRPAARQQTRALHYALRGAWRGVRVILEELVSACQVAVAEDRPMLAVKELVERAVTDRALIEQLPGDGPGIFTLHRGPGLSMFKIVVPPGYTSLPHDHRMWAVVGI